MSSIIFILPLFFFFLSPPFFFVVVVVGFHDGDFLFLVADAAAESVQYGFQEKVCNAVQVADNQLVSAWAAFLHSFYYVTFESPIGYSRQFLMNETAPNAGRTWWFQVQKKRPQRYQRDIRERYQREISERERERERAMMIFCAHVVVYVSLFLIMCLSVCI